MSHILILGAMPKSLVNFRGDLITALVRSGHQVIAMAAPASSEMIAQIEALGATFQPFPVQRNGLNPLADLRTFVSLYKAFQKNQPDIILAYTIKPVIWGGLAAAISTKATFVALIEGLGFAFQQVDLKRKLLGFLVKCLYKIALGRANKVVFLNPDNERVMLESKLVADHKVARINGIGVNVHHFKMAPFYEGPPTFLLIARLLSEKGIREYARAARKVKKKYPEAVFNLLGPEDPSPDGVPLAEVLEWDDMGVIKYLGATHDVRPYLATSCHVYVLPSYHEGMPRTVMEAMATGRPILTTDAPGCRETVIPGENGFLVPVRNANALAERMIWFIEHRDQWEQMGKRSREMAEERFDVRIINRELMRIMGLEEGTR